jgi:FolB domain-containing protein
METTEVGIDSLVVQCILGCMPKERINRRSIEVDVSVTYRNPLAVDAIDKAINYLDIEGVVTSTLTKGSFYLLEAAASAISSALFSAFPSVERLTVTVRKRGTVPGAAYAYARFSSQRGDSV